MPNHNKERDIWETTWPDCDKDIKLIEDLLKSVKKRPIVKMPTRSPKDHPEYKGKQLVVQKWIQTMRFLATNLKGIEISDEDYAKGEMDRHAIYALRALYALPKNIDDLIRKASGKSEDDKSSAGMHKLVLKPKEDLSNYGEFKDSVTSPILITEQALKSFSPFERAMIRLNVFLDANRFIHHSHMKKLQQSDDEWDRKYVKFLQAFRDSRFKVPKEFKHFRLEHFWKTLDSRSTKIEKVNDKEFDGIRIILRENLKTALAPLSEAIKANLDKVQKGVNAFVDDVEERLEASAM